MIGRKTIVAPSMMNSVIWLDEASQTVRLDFGSIEDGMRKGNSDSPAVAMMPKIARLEPKRPGTLALRPNAR